ncbi:MAG TPA: helix-turn-helix transcriptional regulator [Prosthecobacter sp.]|nr:helix-turn-helix transcriptional regulator [Prosthecobacter sp.]
MDVRKTVGLNLRRYRKALGLSQEELAHRANLDRTYVSGMERGIRNPSVLVLQDLAGVLDIHPAKLLEDAGTDGGQSLT